MGNTTIPSQKLMTNFTSTKEVGFGASLHTAVGDLNCQYNVFFKKNTLFYVKVLYFLLESRERVYDLDDTKKTNTANI
jgi:hypothetical protein